MGAVRLLISDSSLNLVIPAPKIINIYLLSVFFLPDKGLRRPAGRPENVRPWSRHAPARDAPRILDPWTSLIRDQSVRLKEVGARGAGDNSGWSTKEPPT